MGEIRYHVLHRRRIVTMAGACNVLEHNLRKSFCSSMHSELEDNVMIIPEYINEDCMQFNTYEGSLSRNAFCKDYQMKMEQVKLTRRPQRNASRIVETVISSTHSFCENWLTNPIEQETMKQYLFDAVAWDQKQHGNVALSIVSHWDESTPHIHILSIPLVGYTDKKTNEQKVKFSSSEFFGGKGDLIHMHDSFHEIVGSKYGLARGQTGSRASHKELRDYKSWEKEQRAIIDEKVKSIEDESSVINVRYENIFKKEKELSTSEIDLKIREGKLRFSENVAKIKRDEFDRIVENANQGAPIIPEPPVSLSRSKLKAWVESVQENVTKAFYGIKAAYESLSDKYNHAVSEIRSLRSANKELYEENLRVKHDLLNKPLQEIQDHRERQRAIKKGGDTPRKDNERNDQGKAR